MPEVVKQISLRKYGEDMTFEDGMSDSDKLNKLLEICNKQHKQIINLQYDVKWKTYDLPYLVEAFKKLYNNVHGIEDDE